MAGRPVLLAYPARTVGPVAQRSLKAPECGTVIAVFGPAFYVEAGGQIVCIGTAALEPGPLGIVTAAPAALDWRQGGFAPGDRASLSASVIRVGNRLRVPLAGAAPWSAAEPPKSLDPAAVARGLVAFRAALSGMAVAEGLARFIDPGHVPGPDDHVGRAAAGPVAGARRWLAGAPMVGDAGELDWACRLTGLGAGLTPAGDDFLGGVMIALRALGQTAAADRLWRSVGQQAGRATNPISLALLRAAAEGMGSDSLHRALAAILRGDAAAIRDSVPAIARIGHSSGWDAMAGVVTVLEARLRSPGESAALKRTSPGSGSSARDHAPGCAGAWAGSPSHDDRAAAEH